MHRIALSLLCTITACGQTNLAAEAQRLSAALQAVQRTPAAAEETCAALELPELRAECITAAVERLATKDPALAHSLCGGLPPSIGRDECFFQRAERSADPTACEDAGRFAMDCRMHLWTQVVVQAVPGGAAPGSFEEELSITAAEAGFEAEDPNPWIPVYRRALGMRRPLDRASCNQAGTELRVATCRNAGVQLYNDLLNHARDTQSFPCAGGPMPPTLAYTADPELDALVAERRSRDLCHASSP